MFARLFSLAAMALVLALLPTASSAAPAGALKDKAQELLTEGNRLAGEGDFGAALLKFRTAHELYPSPKLLLNIGTSLRYVGRNAEAAATYEEYLAHGDADPSREAELRRILEELEGLIGRLELTLGEPDVRVSLDGELIRDVQDGMVVRVDPGRHTVVAEKDGRQPTVRHVSVGELPDPVNLRAVGGWALVALGGAGIVAGAVLGAIAQTRRSEADDHCATEGHFDGYCSPAGAELNDEARTLGGAATIAFVGGFAAGVAGLALVFTAEDEPVTGAIELGPQPGLRVRVTW
ncbi:MAG: hypothetical protein JRI68_20180 [Deltaproteobacteria bacterium]|nr:hypothetical protein [Deltaproteobacteria bacterium]